jgi:AcrR family transcriptional regulator
VSIVSSYSEPVTTPRRRLRTDAARNVERIIDAAQQVFSRVGASAAMEDVAAEAGVGVATVYRRFPTKEALLRAVLDRTLDEFSEAATQPRPETDPVTAMRHALGSAVRFIVDHPNTVSAGASGGLLTIDMAYRFFQPVADVVRRGQQAGTFRDDLLPEDVPRIVLMLIGTLPSFDLGSDGWRRYLDMTVDMLTGCKTQLVAASPVREHRPPEILGVPMSIGVRYEANHDR